MKRINLPCASCGIMLARVNRDTEIKCPSCGAVTKYNALTGDIQCIPNEKQPYRVTASGMTFS